MRSGYHSSRTVSSLCHCVSRELQGMKEYVKQLPTSYNFVNHRVNLVNLSRKLGLNTTGYSVVVATRAERIVSTLDDSILNLFVL
jgi:hypothetical protein